MALWMSGHFGSSLCPFFSHPPTPDWFGGTLDGSLSWVTGGVKLTGLDGRPGGQGMEGVMVAVQDGRYPSHSPEVVKESRMMNYTYPQATSIKENKSVLRVGIHGAILVAWNQEQSQEPSDK